MKISTTQIFWISLTFQTGNSILLTMTHTINPARQDAWISDIIAGIIGLGIVYVATKLSLLYPNQTLIEYSQTILGRWFGKIIVISYFVQWYSVIGVILRGFADFSITILFHETPRWVLISAMLFLVIYSIYLGGIESIGRCSEFLGPMIPIGIAITLVLNIPNVSLLRILPIYSDTGLLSILIGSLTTASFFGESVMMTMLLTFMRKPDQGPSRAMWGLGISAFIVTISTFSVLLTFGPGLSSKMLNPFFVLAGYISVMGFIQNMDVVVVLVYIFSIFIKLSVYFFISCYGTAQWLNIKNWRKTIWFIAPIVFIQSMLYTPGVAHVNYLWNFYIPFAFPINMIGIPLLLWMVKIIRKKPVNLN